MVFYERVEWHKFSSQPIPNFEVYFLADFMLRGCKFNGMFIITAEDVSEHWSEYYPGFYDSFSRGGQGVGRSC